MGQQRKVKGCDERQRLAKVGLAHMAKFLNAGRGQKTLEPEDTSGSKWCQIEGVSGYDTSPEAHINRAAPLRRLALLLQAGDARRRRHAVERHVDKRCYASSRGSTSG